jgi:hypothetical protein
MALSFDLSPAKYLILGSFKRHAFDAALRYAGVPLQAHERFGSLGPLDGASAVSSQRVHRSSGGLCVRYNGASAVMLLRAYERLGSLGPARWKHPNRRTQQSG